MFSRTLNRLLVRLAPLAVAFLAHAPGSAQAALINYEFEGKLTGDISAARDGDFSVPLPSEFDGFFATNTPFSLSISVDPAVQGDLVSGGTAKSYRGAMKALVFKSNGHTIAISPASGGIQTNRISNTPTGDGLFNYQINFVVSFPNPDTQPKIPDLNLQSMNVNFVAFGLSDPPGLGFPPHIDPADFKTRSLAIRYRKEPGGSFRVPGFILTAVAPTEVPEPASLVLFGVGLAGLGLVRRRKAAERT